MAENTSIEWTSYLHSDSVWVKGHTYNPWIGCAKISQGCKFCYAEVQMASRLKMVDWGPKGTRKRTSEQQRRKVRSYNARSQKNGYRERVFCASLADVFEDHPSIEDSWRYDLFSLMEECTHLDFLVLTKRPQNVLNMVPEPWTRKFPENVWIGTTVENQEVVEERLTALLEIPARIRFLSCEPLVGPVNLDGWEKCIDWVIVGGESGNGNIRMIELDWFDALYRFCQRNEIPYFFKQTGAKFARSIGCKHRKGGDITELPSTPFLQTRETPQ